jgi:hypothetical protein
LTLEDMFDAVAERLLAEDAEIERGRMLRSTGLKTGGKFFAFCRDGELVLKLAARRVDELVARSDGRRFDRGDGRPLKEWVVVRPADESECVTYITEARDFVAAQARKASPSDSSAPPNGSRA